MKILLRNRVGSLDRKPLTKEQHAELAEASASLSEGALDRFYRARRVWFDFTTKSFEFEDASPLLVSDM